MAAVRIRPKVRHFQTAGASGVVAANARHSRAAFQTAPNIWRAPRALGQAVSYQISCNPRLHFKELSRSYRTSMVRQGRERSVIDPLRGTEEPEPPGPLSSPKCSGRADRRAWRRSSVELPTEGAVPATGARGRTTHPTSQGDPPKRAARIGRTYTQPSGRS